MNDYWVDGHFIAADTEDAARETAANLYGYTPDAVRPWTAEDQDNLDWQTNDGIYA